jgi:hypothetical protein
MINACFQEGAIHVALVLKYRLLLNRSGPSEAMAQDGGFSMGGGIKISNGAHPDVGSAKPHSSPGVTAIATEHAT